MTDQENHFTVFIRLPFKRGEFVDPPPVAWSALKERELWDVISRQSKGIDLDWNSLAEQFQVTQQFLLQQAAWLYERQLFQVRAQMRRMGTRSSATASPAPGSAAASMLSTQAPKRAAGLTSRGPSRLSTQMPTGTATTDTSVPNTPARSRTSLPLRSVPPTATSSNVRGQPTVSRPLSRKPSKEHETSSRTHSRRGSIQHQMSKSPSEPRPAELTSSSSEDESTTKPSHRRPNPASAQRRAANMRKSQHARGSSFTTHQLQEAQEEDEDEDDVAFLPFVNTPAKAEHSTTAPSDPSATLQGITTQPSISARPTLQRNHTSERVNPAPSTSTMATKTQEQQQQQQPEPRAQPPRAHPPQSHHPLASSTSSLSSNSSPHQQGPPRPLPTTTPSHHRHALSQAGNPGLPTPLSPRQQAALAQAAGLSPRRRAANPSSTTQPQTHHHGYTGSESSPSMGSSFSDLDDASVTQSALEEALMSNMNTLGGTVGGGVGGALGSRVSGISQALRSRYFDARGGGNGSVTGNNGGAQGDSQR